MKTILLTSSFLILAVIALRWLLRGRISLRVQYAVWLLVAARLLLPIEIGQSPLSVLTWADWAEESVLGQMAEDAAPLEGYTAQPDTQPTDAPVLPPQTTPNIPTPADESAMTAQQWLTLIWLTGVAGMAGWILFVNIRFRRRARQKAVRLEVADCPLPVYVTEDIPSPCLLGFFRPAIYLTPLSAEDATRRRHVLAHELTHWRHQDVLWSAVRSLCLCLYWFDPLVWWAASLSRHDCELACDEGALARLGEAQRLSYGRTLVDMTIVSSAPAFLLQTATTMADGSSGIKERISLIARRPKTLLVTALLLFLALLAAVGCTFTGATSEKNKDPQQTDEIVLDPSDPGASSLFASEADPEKFCLAVSPTGVSLAGGDYRYLIPQEQEAFLAAYEKAAAALDENGRWQEGDSQYGFWLLWGEEWWAFTRTGEAIRLSGGRVAEEDAADLFQLCLAACNEANVGDNVRPEEITGITRATLQQGSALSTVTDAEALAKIEALLSSAKGVGIGGAACPFTALLTLEREDGESIAISLATDSCSVWMSEGVAYDYGGSNEDLFACFPASTDGSLTAFLANIKGSDIGGLGWYVGDTHPGTDEAASLLRDAAQNVTKDAATRVDTAEIVGIWHLEVYISSAIGVYGDNTLHLVAGLTENLVEIWGGGSLPDGRLWVEDAALYQLVRTMNDTPDGEIDTAAYNKYKPHVDAFLANVPHLEGVTASRELISFGLAEEKPSIGAELYTIGSVIHVDPAEKAPYYLAGGSYVDSQLRIHWDGGESSILVVIDGEAVGYVNPMWLYVDRGLEQCETKEDLLTAVESFT